MPSMVRILLALAAAVLAPAAGAPAATEPVAWDQQRASALAASLVEATREAIAVAEREGASAFGGRQQQHHFDDFMAEARRFERAVAELAEALAGGRDREETHGLFVVFIERRTEAQEAGSPVYIRGPVADRIGAVLRLIEQLRAYYGPSRWDLMSPLEPGST